MATLGVVVFSLQGMKHLSECLESVRWADEVLVLHAGDGGLETDCSAFPALRIIRVGSLTEAGQHCRAVRSDWVLHLWGQERVGVELAEELRALCRSGSSDGPSAYRIPIRSYLLGRWAEGSVSGPSPAARLGRKIEEIPLGWWREGASFPRLRRGWIGDYACSQLSDGVDHVQGLSDFWAESLRGTDCAPSLTKTMVCALQVFAKMAVDNRLLARGIAGFTLSALASYAVLLSGAKLWEAKHVGARQRM